MNANDFSYPDAYLEQELKESIITEMPFCCAYDPLELIRPQYLFRFTLLKRFLYFCSWGGCNHAFVYKVSKEYMQRDKFSGTGSTRSSMLYEISEKVIDMAVGNALGTYDGHIIRMEPGNKLQNI
jgi:hypothetical protein